MKKTQDNGEVLNNAEIIKNKNQKSPVSSIFESIKNKLIEVGVEYVKTNMEQSKNAIFGFIEKNIENRIRKEIRRYQMIFLGSTILLIGLLFVLYGGFEFISYLAGFPQFITNLLYGFCLLIVGSIIYFKNK